MAFEIIKFTYLLIYLLTINEQFINNDIIHSSVLSKIISKIRHTKISTFNNTKANKTVSAKSTGNTLQLFTSPFTTMFYI